VGVAILVARSKADALGVVALALVVYGAFQTLRGLGRKVWLGLGGADQPLRTFIHRRLGG